MRMVKLSLNQREKDISKMLANAKNTGMKLPRLELEYNNIQKKKLKGNKSLLSF